MSTVYVPSPNRIELDLSFNAIASLLWMRAGSVGPLISEMIDDDGDRKPYDCTEHYAVLFGPDRWRTFVDELPATVRTVFVVTDSTATFSLVCGELPAGVEPVRLYENYLTTFRYGGKAL